MMKHTNRRYSEDARRRDEDEASRYEGSREKGYLAEMFECSHGVEVCDACVCRGRCEHKCVECTVLFGEVG